MKCDYFLDKVFCEFTVITHDEDCHIVTKETGIKPCRFFNKGDRFTSKYSPRIGRQPHGLWAIQSTPVISEELDISRHIQYFQKLFEDKMDIIEKLKNQYHFECVFSIDIETEDAGVGFDLNEAEVTFIQAISSRYSCHFMTKEKIDR
ncbi:hypothetical protein M2137_000688 [Parabacteroides sp. PFB2-10]|uniref:DUF4279 domain-containing protein n=1 Tax=Parabacteroides sp. PFB2-10 TaxID=1742405 RepID=UPI002475C9DE|nr:DUF4279 domain-containing protein [Parabacteroides sp. PFB2-10]MDH6311929.1 hypothetical protein [Parabacteroides sp. PFB2-10]